MGKAVIPKSEAPRKLHHGFPSPAKIFTGKRSLYLHMPIVSVGVAERKVLVINWLWPLKCPSWKKGD